MLHPGSEAGYPTPLDPSSEVDATLISQLRETLGDEFAQRTYGDAAWGRAILYGGRDS